MRVELSPKAEKQLEKLERNPKLSDQIVEGLYTLGKNPLIGKPLEGKLEGLRSFRVGIWRIIHKLVKEQDLILIVRIGRRDDVYR